jgi:hypothetical protein
MRPFFAVFLVTCVIAFARLPERDEARAVELYKYAFERVPPNGFDHSRLRGLLEEDHELLLRWKRQNLEIARAAGMSEESLKTRALDFAILGDEWGVNVIAEQIQRADGYSDHVCWMVRDARIIPKIGELLFREEPYRQEEDIGYWPKQWIIASAIVETLRYAPQFQPDVSNWAAELSEKWGKRKCHFHCRGKI